MASQIFREAGNVFPELYGRAVRYGPAEYGHFMRGSGGKHPVRRVRWRPFDRGAVTTQLWTDVLGHFPVHVQKYL